MGTKRRTRHPDHVLSALAHRQHGVVARWQLLKLGLSSRVIQRRLQSGHLHPVHRGVYAVGHRRLSRWGRDMAAVLYAGPGAVLSYQSAAALWMIRPSSAPTIHVTAARKLHSTKGIRIHYAVLPEDEVTVEDGIPVTTPARTLLDLATVLNRPQLKRAINETEVRRLWDRVSLSALLERYPRRSGSRKIKDVLAELDGGLAVTREELEARFREFIDASGLPKPETNVYVATAGRSYEVDALWRERRLIVELDGYATHGTRSSFESDRAKDRALTAAGYIVIRITWRQLAHEAAALEADLRTLLRRP